MQTHEHGKLALRREGCLGFVKKVPDRQVRMLGATFDVEAELLRDAFQQSRFARTVLADEKRDFGMQF